MSSDVRRSSSSTSSPHYWVTFAVLAASVAAYALLQSLVTPVLSTIQHDLHTDQATVTWVLTAYLLSASISTPILGRIGDRVGKERMLVATLVALAVGSLLAAVASSIGVMIVARVIQGLGGGVLPLSFGIVRDEFPREKVAGAVGLLAALLAVGAGLGIVLAGPIVDLLDYHWLFWIPLVVTVLAAVAAKLLVPESPVRTPGRVSLLPAVLLSAWLVCLLLALSQGTAWGWGSGRIVGLLVAAAVLAVAWVVVESRSSAPLIDMRMMRRPAVWTTNLVALLVGVGLYATFGFLPEFLQTPSAAGYGFGSSITQSGLILLPSSVTMFIVGIASGPLAARFGAKALVVVGPAVAVVTFVLLAFAHDSVWQVCVATGVMGVGFGFAFSAMSSLIVEAVPAEQTGVASGMNANIRTIGGSIGAALMASIVTSGARPDGLPREAGYTHGFAVLGVVTLAAAVAALLIPRTRPAVVEERHAELGIVAAGTLVGSEPE
ncbi:EmrB/QacA subfamily drug resistance transporter [Motilibacter rhizosphaerae]|uniref:EmrB/QacA subfamily drug resistance transporter n=1 Tax=Motilibacter rhizosphaerae TaxID=598652 RepID=A0A4Q7NV89_9ACTN|nr:MFS transporter [Motilibacter rhizosphaerae]RZS91075.1 EmrB/QacA subfamily drug resistance transporter [Motilibacter rhizosphaerae]